MSEYEQGKQAAESMRGASYASIKNAMQRIVDRSGEFTDYEAGLYDALHSMCRDHLMADTY